MPLRVSEVPALVPLEPGLLCDPLVLVPPLGDDAPLFCAEVLVDDEPLLEVALLLDDGVLKLVALVCIAELLVLSLQAAKVAAAPMMRAVLSALCNPKLIIKHPKD